MKATALSLLAASALTIIACASPTSPSESTDSSESPIVGGIEATPGEWDGAVIVQKGGRLVCGGTLIAAQWVLTASHCVTASSATGGFSGVVIGRHKQSTTDGVVIPVDRAFRHETYGRPSRFDNDIALIHLTTPAPKSATRATLVKPAQMKKIVDGAKVTVVGWGTTAAGGSISDVLREVEVPVIDNTTCKAFPQYSTVTGTMICAGLPEGGKDSCQGDSGGPLYINIDKKWTQIGLTSWGIGCAGRNAPGVYNNTGLYTGWIFEKTAGEAGYDPNAVEPPTDGGAPDAAPTPGQDAGAAAAD